MVSLKFSVWLYVFSLLQDMLCAIADLESDRRPLANVYNKKSKETMTGIMQISSKTAQWLFEWVDASNYTEGFILLTVQ